MSGQGRHIATAIFLLLLFLGYSTKSEGTEPLDVNNFDFNTWNRIRKEAKIRENSRERIGYYGLGKVDVAFRPVVESFDESSDAIWMTDHNGKRYLIAKALVIDSQEIEGIEIEKTTFLGKEDVSIVVLFKQESWNRIYKVTKELAGHNMGFVMDGQLLSAPHMYDALIHSASFSGGFSSEEIGSITKGLIAQEPPSDSERNSAYMAWLEAYAQSHPEDRKILTLLVDNKIAGRDCGKAAELSERIFHADPSRLKEALYTLQCYQSVKEYDAAEQFYKRIPLDEQQDAGDIRTLMAEIYLAKGERQKAIEELGKELETIKAEQPDIPPHIKGLDRNNYLEKKRTFKHLKIKALEEAIEHIKAAPKQSNSLRTLREDFSEAIPDKPE